MRRVPGEGLLRHPKLVPPPQGGVELAQQPVVEGVATIDPDGQADPRLITSVRRFDGPDSPDSPDSPKLDLAVSQQRLVTPRARPFEVVVGGDNAGKERNETK
jgi:hypothetical protein